MGTQLHRAAPLFVLLIASAAGAEPRLQGFFGGAKPTADTFEALAAQSPPQDMPAAPARGEVMFNAAIQKLVNIIARPLHPDATTVQRNEYDETRAADLAAEVLKLPGNTVRLAFRVVDICPRPTPAAPTPPRGKAGPAELEKYAALKREYDEKMAEIAAQPLVAIGEMSLTNAVAKVQDDNAELRKRLAEVAAEITTLRRRIQGPMEKNARDSLRARIASLEKRRQELAAQIKRASADGEGGSDDYVYILGTEEKFGTWRKSQRRAAIGWVERVKVHATGRSRESADIKLDAVIRLMEDDGDAATSTTQPTEPMDTTKPEGSATE